MNARKLLHHEKVEVRQLEEGLGGSWHPAVVIGVSDSCRKVMYDELLCGTGREKLVESIPVTGAIEGLYQRPSVKSNYRGRIRPRPPLPQPTDVKQLLGFGVCVDVLYKEAWWEGVIFDYDEGADERCVYFPDERDERRFKLTDIRTTFVWDEYSGNWRERGVWTLVNLANEYKKEGNLFQLIKRVWSRLKVHYGFLKMISEWTCGAYCVWKEYFRDIVCEISSKVTPKGVSFSNFSQLRAVRKRRRRDMNASVLTRSMQKRKEKELSLAVRTRRMYMSEPERSTISAAPKSSVLTEVSEAGEDSLSEGTPNVHSGQFNESGMEWEGYQNDSFPTTSFRNLESKTSPSRRCCSRRTWRRTEKKVTPRKLKPSKRYDCRLHGRANNGSKIRKVRDGVSLWGQDCETVDQQKGLMLQRMKKGDRNMRSILRQQRKNRISARRIRKKRSPLSIKKIVGKKTQDAKAKSKPLFETKPEASKISLKEVDKLDSHWQGSLPGTSSHQEFRPEDSFSSPISQRGKRSRFCDSVCFVCQYGGELLHCDHCLSSYHFNCIGLKEAPAGESCCPSCRCGLCGLKSIASHKKIFTEVCYQCSRQYHVDCLENAGISFPGDSFSDKFCSKNCYEICARLHELLQVSSPTRMEGLTWTITRSRRNDCNVHSERVHPLVQVSQVLKVLHECFEPIIEPHTGRDLVAVIVYNSGSKFRRLDFHGFYVMALVKGEEIVCVATIRIHGQKVAEMPLIATCFEYRRKGMCRLLLDELEKMLVEMGVERLVLPGIAQLSDTWVSSFGFTEMPDSLRKELSGYPFVLFQGTTLFQKILHKPVLADSSQLLHESEATVTTNAEENKVVSDRRFSRQLYYKRRGRSRNLGKKKSVLDGSDKNQSTNRSACELVYKRRRIRASRDSLDDLKLKP